jgi:DNA-binding GntR family transcriptional regulator
MDAEIDGRSHTDRAYQRLRAEILHGELASGERLRVAELQERFNLGLTPIREALVRLSIEGMVTAETHRGSRVTETSAAELTDLMATRREIERLCLAGAIARGDADWEAEIVTSMYLLQRAALPASPEDRAAATAWESQHRRFHLALVAACGSAWLLRFWTTLVDHSERYRNIRLLRHRDANALVRDVNAEHQAIMQAVLARNTPAAVALMEAHLTATERAVANFLTPVSRDNSP